MKDSCFRHSTKTHLAVTLLLVLFAVTVPNPAAALTYTYTGNPYTYEMNGSFYGGKNVGNHLTISFSYNGDLSTVVGQNLTFSGPNDTADPALSNFTMTSGNESPTFSGSINREPFGNLVIFSMSNGLPATWEINLYDDAILPNGNPYGWELYSSNTTFRVPEDRVDYTYGVTLNGEKISYNPGVWTKSNQFLVYKIKEPFLRWVLKNFLGTSQTFDLDINNLGGDSRNYVYVGIADPTAPNGVNILAKYFYNLPDSGFGDGAVTESVPIPQDLWGLSAQFVTGLQLFDDSNPDVEISGLGTPVPVPPSVWLLGSSLLGLVGWRRFGKG